MDKSKLTIESDHGGCAAKVDADTLERILALWSVRVDPLVLLGLKEQDDAGIYDLGNGTALVQSIDVITPVVNEPEVFGRIAVAHALSDIYAKGAKPIFALSLLGFSAKETSVAELESIMAGCSLKLSEANVVLLGGHTMATRELLLGFAVTGLVGSDSFLALRGARPGDRLVLTKGIGSGIISTSQRLANFDLHGVSLHQSEVEAAVRTMAQLNNHAARLMMEYGSTASTDVSGFGLLGHLSNLVRASSVGARIEFSLVPKLPGTMELLSQGIAPARIDENLSHYQELISIGKEVDSHWPILYCPETSGGLLVAITPDRAPDYVDALRGLGVADCSVIGEIVEDSSNAIIVAP